MGKCCAAVGCSHAIHKAECKEKKISFHNFPLKDNELLMKWYANLKKKDFVAKQHHVLCSDHFEEGEFVYQPFTGRRQLKSGAIPTQFAHTPLTLNRKRKSSELGQDISTKDNEKVPLDLRLQKDVKDYTSVCSTDKNSENHKVQPNIVLPEAKLSDSNKLGQILCAGKNSENKEHSNVRAPSLDHDYIIKNDISVSRKIKALEEQIENLKATIKKKSLERFCLERFSSNDRLIKMYTGFPNYKTLKSFFQAISTFIPAMVTWSQVLGKAKKSYPITDNRMQPIDQLFMFLNKLKLGSVDQDLADKFLVAQTTVSRNTITWANFLYFVLGSQPLWPSRQKVQQFMPKCFRGTHPKTRVIIDCVEIKVQGPSNPKLSSEFYSNSKGRATVKGLIGVTPGGAVSFVSNLYTGSASAETLTLGSGVLNLLEEGDEIMADKDFHISDLMKEKNIPLVSVHFSLSPKDKYTRKKTTDDKAIAEVELLVEKYIRRCKSFHFFESAITFNLIRTINQLWAVACILTNFQHQLIEPNSDVEYPITASTSDDQYQISAHSDDVECPITASTSDDQYQISAHSDDVECSFIDQDEFMAHASCSDD